ncbi:MAG: hypothetical protein ACXADY_01045 [Candidatus Hodarchaeales archaeon]|jgi:hypothetical protein
MSITELGHIHMTIIEMIVDGSEVDKQSVFERINDMMALLGETIQENDFLKEIEKLLEINVIEKVVSSSDKYKITDHGKETFLEGLE